MGLAYEEYQKQFGHPAAKTIQFPASSRLCLAQPGKNSNNLRNRFGSLDTDQLLIQSAIEIGQFIGIESKLR